MSHDALSANFLVNEERSLVELTVTAMNSTLNYLVKKEAYIAVGNLLTTVSCQDLAQLLDWFPELLRKYVEGLSYFVSNEECVMHIL